MLLPPIKALPPAPQITAIVGATLLDGTGAPPLKDAVLIFREKRIVAVGKRGEVDIPEEARQIEGTGKWLIPGLIDMHVHLDEDISPEAFVLFGVTSVRDVGSRLVTLQKLRARATTGEIMPNFYWMGRNIDQGKPSWWGAVAVKDARGVPALLRDMAKQGVNGVKLYVRSGTEVTRTVVQEAHKRGWPVTGHLEDTTPGEAARAGIDNLEHVATLFLELTRKTPKKKSGYGSRFALDAHVNLNGPKAQRLLTLLKKHQVAVTPTLAVVTMPVEGEKAAEARYRGWADIPAGWRAFWKTGYWNFISTKGWTEADYRLARQARTKYIEMVRRLDKAGVPLVAGTDTPALWVLPGAGLLLELEGMVEAGISPLRAIHAATGRAAEILHKSSDVGTLRPGRFADFVLLDANPLQDIRNLRRIDSVTLHGRRVDRAALKTRFHKANLPRKRRSSFRNLRVRSAVLLAEHTSEYGEHVRNNPTFRKEAVTMNWDTIEGNWKQLKGKIREKWGKLTDDDYDAIAGRREQFIGKLQERYGYAREEAERQADDWMNRSNEWGNDIPGIQTGGRAVDGTPDTRGIMEKVADAVTGDRVDDKTGKIVR